MTRELFLFTELLRSLRAKTWILSLGAVVAVAIFAGTLALVSLLLHPGTPGWTTRLIAVPSPAFSQADLAALHERLLDDPAVAYVRYVFSPETTGGFEITLRSDSELVPLTERLQAWGMFEHVGPPREDSLAAWRAGWLNPEGRWITSALLLSLLGLTLLALYASLASARRSFAGELELLDLSGAPPPIRRAPFLLLGALYGLLGALLVHFAVDGAWAALGFAELWEPERIDQLSLRSLLLGLAFVGVGALLGWLAVHRYPSPFRRSRIRSSSVEIAE
jgi:hypothetical protein